MVISLSGPSGIGKGYIKEKLLRTYPCIEELAWFTTRALRPNEQCGNRIHVSLSEFNGLVESGNLALVQDIFGNRYGLRKEDLLAGPRIKLTEIHPDNVKEALEINPAILAIGFVTSDFSLLYERLSAIRKTEDLVEIDQRISKAQSEIETILLQESLFTAVIEVAKTSEDLVFDQVLTILAPHLTQKGQRPCR